MRGHIALVFNSPEPMSTVKRHRRAKIFVQATVPSIQDFGTIVR